MNEKCNRNGLKYLCMHSGNWSSPVEERHAV